MRKRLWKNLLLAVVVIITGTVSASCEWYFAKYWLTVSIQSGHGTTDPAVGRSGPYLFDQVVSVSATPDQGWQLKEIIEDHDGDTETHTQAPVQITMDRRSVEVKADVYFEPIPGNYYVSSTSYLDDTTTECEGTVALSPAGGSYAPNTQVTITFTPAAGMEFVEAEVYRETSGGWILDRVTGDNPLQMLVTGNMSVHAYFKNAD